MSRIYDYNLRALDGRIVGFGYNVGRSQPLCVKQGSTLFVPCNGITSPPESPPPKPKPPLPVTIIKTRQDRKKWQRYRRTRRGLGDGDLPRFVPTVAASDENGRVTDNNKLSTTEIAIVAIALGSLLFFGK